MNPQDPIDYRAMYMQLQGRLARGTEQAAQQERDAQAAAQAAGLNQSGSSAPGAVTPFVRQTGLGYGSSTSAQSDASAITPYGQIGSGYGSTPASAPAMGANFMQQINSLPRQVQYTAHGARVAVPAQFVGTGRGRGRGRGGSGANGGRVPVYLSFGGKGMMKRAYWCPARHILREGRHLFNSDHKIAVLQAEWLANNGFSQVINLCKGLTSEDTAKVVSDQFPVMYGIVDFVLARYGPAGIDYNPVEAKHVKSLSEGSDGFAAFFTGVKWPTLCPANFDNEVFGTHPLDSELDFINNFNAATRRIVSELYPGTQDEPDLYLSYPAAYVGPCHPDYKEPDVICHLCGAGVSPTDYDQHVNDCSLYDNSIDDGFNPKPAHAEPRAPPKFAPGAGAQGSNVQGKGKKTPRQIEREEFGSIVMILVSEDDHAYEAFRKFHQNYVAEAKGDARQAPGESTGESGVSAVSDTTAAASGSAPASPGREQEPERGPEELPEVELETAADRAKRQRRNNGKAAPVYTATSRAGGKSKK
ncbi:hypothetical protein NCC49_006064 [Naganishia albida]|nr:hypothetical protein NCC49_006064 [Naganishia albida]